MVVDGMNRFLAVRSLAYKYLVDPEAFLWGLYVGSNGGEIRAKNCVMPIRCRPRSRRVKVSDFDIVREVALEDTYGIRGMFFEPRLRVLDIGAHIGTFVWHLSQFAEVELVVAIEAHPRNYRVLRANCGAEGWPRTVAMEGSVGVGSGARLVEARDNTGGHHFAAGSEGICGVRRLDLGCLSRRHAADGWDVVKVDAEGSEVGILEEMVGGSVRVKRLVMEVHEYRHRFGRVRELLRALGHREIEIHDARESEEGSFCVVRSC